MPRASKIFVGNIAIGTSSDELRELFSSYGLVTECDVLGAGNYAFVHMAVEEEAETAIRELRNYVLNGSALNIERSTSETQGRKRKEFASNFQTGPGGHSGIPKRNTTKIFIGNVKDGTTADELRTLFEQYGGVSEADVCSGYGFVHMQFQNDAIKAIKAINGYYLNGNRLNVELSTAATQGRSSVPVNPPVRGGAGGRGGRRSRGNLIQVGNRYDPYSRHPIGGSSLRSLHATDPYASASLGYGLDSYGAGDFSAGPYSSAAPAALAPASSDDGFARDLLNLYFNDPAAFDKFAKDPSLRQTLNLVESADPYDPYYRPPKEYYEARNTAILPDRSASYIEVLGSSSVGGYAPVPKRPLLPIGSGRGGMAGIGMPLRGPLGLAPMVGHRPMGVLGFRPRAAAPRPALYTSFE